MIGLKSSGSGFASLAARFDGLAEKAPAAMAKNGAEIAQVLLEAEYATESDPRRKKWKRKKTPNGKPQGVASGDTKDSVKAEAVGDGIELTVGTDHATFLQGGTTKMKPRKILPEDVLTGIWKTAIDEAAHQGIHEAWGKG
jgi:hypothetical protein